MEIPFEILKHTFRQLDQLDRFRILTVCKTWYRPAFETLYYSVDIRSTRAFRAFLYTIAHHELQFGNYVRVLNLFPEDKSDYSHDTARSVTFTEFEVLSRHCPALEELCFHNTRYWKYLKELDWKNTWLHLRKIPPANCGHRSIRVYCKMGQRVTELEIGTFVTPANFKSILPKLTQLKQLILNRYSLDAINMDILNAIHTKLPLLEHLVVKTRFDDMASVPLSASTEALKSLSCYVYSPKSTWLSLIRENYSHIPSLTLYILNEEQKHSDNILSEPFGRGDQSVRNMHEHETFGAENTIGSANNSIVNYLPHLIDLYDFSPIPYIDIMFQSFCSVSQLGQLILFLSQQQQRHRANFSLNFTYYDSYDLAEFSLLPTMTERNLYISTNKENNEVYHLIQYHTLIPEQQDEMQMFHQLPATDLITELSLIKRVTSTETTRAHLDELLYELPMLHKAIFGCDVEHTVVYTISTLVFSKRKHLHLKYITFANARVRPCVFTYLFENCHLLQEINLLNCDIGEEVLLATEYYCLKHNIELNVK